MNCCTQTGDVVRKDTVVEIYARLTLAVERSGACGRAILPIRSIPFNPAIEEVQIRICAIYSIAVERGISKNLTALNPHVRSCDVHASACSIGRDIISYDTISEDCLQTIPYAVKCYSRAEIFCNLAILDQRCYLIRRVIYINATIAPDILADLRVA